MQRLPYDRFVYDKDEVIAAQSDDTAVSMLRDGAF
jgi:hypothetical protein